MAQARLNLLLDLRRQFLGFVQRRVRNANVAEDILQSAYMRALCADGDLRESGSSVAWFYRILRNAVIDHYRRQAAEGAALERWTAELETEVQPDPVLYNATCQCIHGALEILKPSYASVLREVDLKGVALGAYAASQQISVGNAAVRAHRARTALKKQLIRCCGSCSEHGCLDCICRATKTLQKDAVQKDAVRIQHSADKRSSSVS